MPRFQDKINRSLAPPRRRQGSAEPVLGIGMAGADEVGAGNCAVPQSPSWPIRNASGAHRNRQRRCPSLFNGKSSRFAAAACAAALAASGGPYLASPANAFEFGDDLFQGSLDTTISHGVTFRLQKPNGELAGKVNSNDGNLNYDDDSLVSNTSKFTSDLDLSFGNFGAFVRATGYIDFENRLGFRDRTSSHPGVTTGVGSDLEILDAYVTASFDSDSGYVDFRLGKHVLNWGESTFIPNGINAINPFDVGKLRLPGAELRDALLPVSMISASFAPNDVLSFEGFYQLDWQKTRIDPVGSYFSTTDYVGAGARKAVISNIPGVSDRGFGFGPLTPAINTDLDNFMTRHPQLGIVSAPQPRQPEFDRDFASVRRGPDSTPPDAGQWGLAVHYLAEDLNETDFGFYFMNYHSRLPVVSGATGGIEGIQAGLAAAQAVAAPGSATSQAAASSATMAAQGLVAAGLLAPENVPSFIQRTATETVSGIAQAMAIDRFAKTSQYFIEYPEDIKLFGLSFNTVLGTSGWALQGEYSQRQGVPLQRAERAVIGDGLTPIITALTLANQNPALLPAYLQSYRPETVKGYIRRDVSQFQLTATKVFGPMLGADGVVLVSEAALMHVHNMPDKAVMPLESAAGGILPLRDADADMNSWGYRIAARLDYLNAIGSVNLHPYTQFLHDVHGNSPAPSGPFIEGRTGFNIGIRADYLSSWQADVGVTFYAGDGNDLSDRDFAYASVKYSF